MRNSIISVAVGLLLCAEASPHQGGTMPVMRVSAVSDRVPRTIEELQGLICNLRIGMPEREARAILGPPDFCPTEGQCYYASAATDRQGWSITLVVEYRGAVKSKNGFDDKVTHRLESYSLGPVGE